MRERLARRAQPAEVVRVLSEALRGSIAAGQLVVVPRMRVHRRPGRLLRSARVAVVIDVSVRDEDAADLSQTAADGAKSGEQRVASLARADPRIEQGETAAVLLDDVDVRRAARLSERHRYRDATDPEPIEERGAHPSFLTASLISGRALKRSATNP